MWVLFEKILNVLSSTEISLSIPARMVGACFTAFLIAFMCGKYFILKLFQLKVGDRVRQEHCPLLGQLHRNKNDTPTMGGLLILCAALISLFVWMDLTHPFTWLLFLTIISMGTLGGIDDYLKLKYKNKSGVPAKIKFFWQILFSLCVGLYLLSHERTAPSPFMQLSVPFLANPFIFSSVVALILLLLFFVFIICGTSNAVNLTDGLDGLAAGTLIVAFSVFAYIALDLSVPLSLADNVAYQEGVLEIAIFLVALVGALVGFLWYNCYPAQLFMGDIGSLTLGAVLGVVSVLLRQELLLGIVGAVFVAEALSVILQVGSYKFRNKKRIFLIAPLHHHFEYKGYTEPKVVMRFWIVALLFAGLGLVAWHWQV